MACVAAVAGLLLSSSAATVSPPGWEEIALPPLRLDGAPARAHTQGLEVAGETCFVTARREDRQPRQALLLRTRPGRSDWDGWDITPRAADGRPPGMDHPGGLQSDGTRLWIPVAESRRRGRSVIRAYRMAALKPRQPASPEIEFAVDDHIGALAVDPAEGRLFGANWDTETVYVWDRRGRLVRRFEAGEMTARRLGVTGGADARTGLAVQDWKLVSGRLYASGLLKGPGAGRGPRSRLFVFERFGEGGFSRTVVPLPVLDDGELAREAMAVAGGWVWFLPGDLGATNRLFRVPLQGRLAKGRP